MGREATLWIETWGGDNRRGRRGGKREENFTHQHNAVL